MNQTKGNAISSSFVLGTGIVITRSGRQTKLATPLKTAVCVYKSARFYGLKRQFSSQFLSIKNKIKLYKTLIRPVLAYGSETWVLSKCDETVLGVPLLFLKLAIFVYYTFIYQQNCT